MSNKNLLNESTVRRFMKLASLHPISDSFIHENFREEDITEAEDTEEGTGSTIEEGENETSEAAELEEMAYAREDEEAPEEPEAEMDMAPEEEGPAPEAEASKMETFAKEVAQALADALHSASDGSISVSVEGGDEEPAAAEPEDSMEMGDEMPPAEEEGEEEVMMEEDDFTSEIDLSEEAREEIVKEVFKRVAKRLLQGKVS